MSFSSNKDKPKGKEEPKSKEIPRSKEEPKKEEEPNSKEEPKSDEKPDFFERLNKDYVKVGEPQHVDMRRSDTFALFKLLTGDFKHLNYCLEIDEDLKYYKIWTDRKLTDEEIESCYYR